MARVLQISQAKSDYRRCGPTNTTFSKKKNKEKGIGLVTSKWASTLPLCFSWVILWTTLTRYGLILQDNNEKLMLTCRKRRSIEYVSRR